MSKSKKKDMLDFRKSLDDLCREGEYSTVIVIFSSEDGMFTNAEGVKNFFTDYALQLDIILVMHLGYDDWKHYRMNDILEAIRDIEGKTYRSTPSHDLVFDWVTISLDKEQLVSILLLTLFWC